MGSTPALGEWSTARAVPMAWSAGGVWRAALRLPPDPGVLFYKVFLKARRRPASRGRRRSAHARRSRHRSRAQSLPCGLDSRAHPRAARRPPPPICPPAQTDGAVCAWQSGGNNMVALPRPGEAPPCAVVLAHSCWDATPTASTDAAQAQLMSRFAGVEAAVGQAEAAARAAGLVAKTCLTELLAAREEAALALRFITRRGLVREFERASSGAGVAPSGAGGAVTDREIDDEIAAILERQLNGDSELRRESR